MIVFIFLSTVGNRRTYCTDQGEEVSQVFENDYYSSFYFFPDNVDATAITFYEHGNFQGKALTQFKDNSCFDWYGEINDMISSFKFKNVLDLSSTECVMDNHCPKYHLGDYCKFDSYFPKGERYKCDHGRSAGEWCNRDGRCKSRKCLNSVCQECGTDSFCEKQNNGYCRQEHFSENYRWKCHGAHSAVGQWCGRDGNCESKHCLDGKCVECVLDKECPESKYCRVEGITVEDKLIMGVLIPGSFEPGNVCDPRKSFGQECAKDRECSSNGCRNGKCVQCLYDTMCSSGQFCEQREDLKKYQCVESANQGMLCARDGQCSSKVCMDNYCKQCRFDEHCLEGEFCAYQANWGNERYTCKKQFTGEGSLSTEDCKEDYPNNVVTSYGGFCFVLIDQLMFWENANAHCVGMGGTLPIVNSPELNYFLSNFYSGEYWLGLKEGSSWVWSNGVPMQNTYTNWRIGEPSGSWERYAESNFLVNGEWNDIPNSYNRGVICQIAEEACTRDGECETYACSSGGECVGCVKDAHCKIENPFLTREYCNLANQKCEISKNEGESCSRNLQCQSQVCEGGVCIEKPNKPVDPCSLNPCTKWPGVEEYDDRGKAVLKFYDDMSEVMGNTQGVYVSWNPNCYMKNHPDAFYGVFSSLKKEDMNEVHIQAWYHFKKLGFVNGLLNTMSMDEKTCEEPDMVTAKMLTLGFTYNPRMKLVTSDVAGQTEKMNEMMGKFEHGNLQLDVSGTYTLGCSLGVGIGPLGLQGEGFSCEIDGNGWNDLAEYFFGLKILGGNPFSRGLSDLLEDVKLFGAKNCEMNKKYQIGFSFTIAEVEVGGTGCSLETGFIGLELYMPDMVCQNVAGMTYDAFTEAKCPEQWKQFFLSLGDTAVNMADLANLGANCVMDKGPSECFENVMKEVSRVLSETTESTTRMALKYTPSQIGLSYLGNQIGVDIDLAKAAGFLVGKYIDYKANVITGKLKMGEEALEYIVDVGKELGGVAEEVVDFVVVDTNT